MSDVLQRIYEIGIVPVIAIDDAEKAVPLAKALVRGGLPAAEVTFRTAAAEEAIRRIVAEVPDMLVGAGTVLTKEQADRAIDAGRMGMSQNAGPPGAYIIQIPVVIHIDQKGARRLFHKKWRFSHRAEGAHRAVHSAGHPFTGSFI